MPLRWCANRRARPPCCAQEYTLVAIVAVAAHLSQFPLGERFGLPVLAAQYRQDVDALEQVGRRPACLQCLS